MCLIYVLKTHLIEGLDETVGGNCASCDNISFGQCMKCMNCGFCASKYSGKCVKGSLIGPDKNTSCRRYYQNDIFWNYAKLINKTIVKPFIE